MPHFSRGLHYYTQVSRFLRCADSSHAAIADEVYAEILREQRGGTPSYFKKSNCGECGSIIMVTVRQNGEWEQNIFPPKKIEGSTPSKERI